MKGSGCIKDNHSANPPPLKEINLLWKILKQHLQWNAARLTFESIFLIALIRVKTVNPAKIAAGFSCTAKGH